MSLEWRGRGKGTGVRGGERGEDDRGWGEMGREGWGEREG